MFRKRFAMLLTLTLALAVSAGACTPAAAPGPTVIPPAPTVAPTLSPTVAPSPTPIALTDGLGRAVTLNAPAQRIVSLGPSNTEILFAIGAGSQIVGRDDFSDYPAEAANIPGVGATYGNFSAEAIVAVNPDLVLMSELYTTEQVKSLEDVGLTIFWLANPTDWGGLYANLLTVGQLTGHASEAQALTDSLKSRVTAVVEKVKGAAQPKVFYEIDATDPTKPYTTGPGTFVDVLIATAGGANVGAALGTPYGQLSSEELVKQNPDVIVLGDSLYGVTVESVGQRAGWEAIAAVKNGTVYVFDDNLASRPGPRLVDGLEAMAKLIHPELFR